MKKKMIALLLGFVIVLSLAACSSQKNIDKEQNTKAEATETQKQTEEETKIEQRENSEETSQNTMRYSAVAMEQIESLGKTIENEQIVLIKSGSVEDMDFVWYRVYVYEDGVNLREENYYFVVEGATEKLISTANTWDENGNFTTSDSRSLTIYEEDGWLVTTKEAPGYTWSGNSWKQDYDYLKENPDIGTIIE